MAPMQRLWGQDGVQTAWLELVEDGTADTVEGGAISMTRTSGSPIATEVKQSRGSSR